MRISNRTALAALAGLVGLAAISTATPASADEWHGRHNGWRNHYYPRERVVVVNRPYWRPYYAPRPVYVAPRYYVEPAPVYAPPPVYYGPPSISLTVPLR